MLDIKNLEVRYGGVRAIKDLSIKIRPREIVGIIGPNGAGKTTLLKGISGLIPKSNGCIFFLGEDISLLSPKTIVRKGISQVPEGRQLFGPMTVQENLLLGSYLMLQTGNKKAVDRKIDLVYRLFPVLDKQKKQIAGTLSGGQQQMLAIARGLMADPKLLLLDEPSLGLAPLVVEQIFEAISELNKAGTTILLVEQNVKIALAVSERCYVMSIGEVLIEGLSGMLAADERIKEIYLGQKQNGKVRDS